MATAPNDGSAGTEIEDSALRFSFIEMIENLLYYWPWFIAVAVLCTVIGILVAIVATPIYTADVLIQVEPQKSSSLGALKDVSALIDTPQSPITGEIEVMKSRLLLNSAVEASGADLDIAVLDRMPVFGDWLSRRLARDSGGLAHGVLPLHYAWGGETLEFAHFDVDERLRNVTFIVVAGAEAGSFDLTDGQRSIAQGRVGQEVIALQGRLRFSVRTLVARPKDRFAVTRHAVIDQARSLVGEFQIAEAGRGSNIIRASCDDPDPVRATKLIDALADAYVSRNITRRSEEAARSLVFLRGRLPQLKAQLEHAEGRLNAYRNSQSILDLSAETKALLDRAVALETARQTLELQKRQMALQYEPAHPEMRSIEAQLKSLGDQIREAETEIKQLPAREQEYLQLMRDVQVDNQLYVGLLNNAEQLEIAKAGTIGNVVVIDRAVQPNVPTKPKKARIAADGGLLGIFLGFAAAQLIALLAGVVRDPKKLEAATGLPAIAILPQSPEQVDGSPDAHLQPAFLVAQRYPQSPIAESLRSLRTAVQFALSATPRGKVVVVGSATPSQGKSLVAANLSYLMAGGGRRVLIVDADIRRRSLKEYLPIPASAQGLAEVLAGDATASDCVIPEVMPGLSVLPPGAGVRDPGRLFLSSTLPTLIDWAVASYDLVIIDSAPILAVSDTLELAKFADELLFVVRQNEVSLAEVTEALTALRRLGRPVNGFVFNGYLPSRLRYGYGYGYGYGYRYRYGRRYGQAYGSGSEDGSGDSR